MNFTANFAMLLLALLVGVLANVADSQQLTEEQMIERLRIYDEDTKDLCNRQSLANWAVQTDVGNETNEEAQVSKNERELENVNLC